MDIVYDRLNCCKISFQDEQIADEFLKKFNGKEFAVNKSYICLSNLYKGEKARRLYRARKYLFDLPSECKLSKVI